MLRLIRTLSAKVTAPSFARFAEILSPSRTGCEEGGPECSSGTRLGGGSSVWRRSSCRRGVLPSLAGGAWGWVFILLFFSCSDAERLFDTYPVRFVVQNTNTNEVMNDALTGLGEFCTVVNKGSSMEYSNLKTTMPVNLNARELGYGYFNFGRSNGFVVGHTSMISSRFPDQVVCYDIVCPNCYENRNVTRNVELLSGARAQCSSCQRTYDLNELGMVIQGEAGRSLFRYSVRYAPFQLVIGN